MGFTRKIDRVIVDPAPGMAVRLEGWTNCVVEVMDVGRFTFWGRLVDIKTDEVISSEYICPLHHEWELAMDAKLFIMAIS